jgi:hypothetical protein
LSKCCAHEANGFHLDATGDGVWLEGHDAGVSMVSQHDPSASITCTVLANWSEGAWPMVRMLGRRLGI